MSTVNIRNVLGLLARHYRVETMQTTEPNSKEHELMGILKGVIEEFESQSLFDTEFTTTVVYDSEILPGSSSNDANFSSTVPERDASPDADASSEASSVEYEPEQPEKRQYTRIPAAYKRDAVRYWETRGKTKKLSLQTVNSRYSRVTSLSQLYKWKRDMEEEDTNGK